MITKQKIFNEVVRGLAAQDFERSVDALGGCYYRTHDGKRCAAGCLIPDETYSRDMEGQSIDLLFGCMELDGELITDRDHIDLVCLLQELHDDDGPAPLRDRLTGFASRRDLTWPEDVK